MEPSVSVPRPSSLSPPATAEAGPLVEPPGSRSGAAGLRGIPKWTLSPLRLKASSAHWPFATTDAPASVSLVTAAPLSAAGSCAAAHSGLPPPVTAPATSITSLTTTFSPSSGPAPFSARAESSGSQPGTSAPNGSTVTRLSSLLELSTALRPDCETFRPRGRHVRPRLTSVARSPPPVPRGKRSTKRGGQRGKPGFPRSSEQRRKAPLRSVGASRTRTGDLLGAIQALSQLSYSPGRGTV